MIPRFRCDIPATGRSDLPLLHAALLSWGLARAGRGDFILRLEEAPAGGDPPLLADLRTLGLDWDEGPDVGGEYEPYVQAARQQRYRAVVDRLLQEGSARRAPAGTLLSAPRPPASPETLRGELRTDDAPPDGAVLIDAADQPTRLLRTVVDDHDMAITHAVHPAEDRRLLADCVALTAALAWTAPVWVLLPQLQDEQGAPLAGRDEYGLPALQSAGYLPAAIWNYLLLQGWAPGQEEELLDRWTVRRRLDLDRFTPEPVRFDPARLGRINKHYLSALSAEDLAALTQPLLDEAYGRIPAAGRWLLTLVELLRADLARLVDIVPRAAWAFAADIEYTDAARDALLQEDAGLVLVRLIAAIARDAVLLDEVTASRIFTRLTAQLQHAELHPAVPAALLGRLDGPAPAAVCGLLGREQVLERLAAAVRWRTQTAPDNRR